VSNGGLRLHSVDKSPGANSAAATSASASSKGGKPLAAPGLEAYDWAGACLTASWSADGRVLASGMQDGSLHFWRLAAGEQSQMRGYGAKVSQTSWSANSRYLASAATEKLVVWDFSGRGPEGTAPIELNGHSARVTSLAFRPAGAHLVSGGRDWRLMLWRPGAHLDPEDAHLLGGEVVLLSWSRDGRWLAAGDSDGTLSVFEFSAGAA
jgi:WD40 repeat protein